MPTPSIFTRIVNGEIPAAKVLETDFALAFLDINPINQGHVLLVPKEQVATVGELSDELSSHVAALLPRLCRAVVAATGAEGYNVIANNGAVAGQTIDHVHWHIIPRFAADAVRWPWPHQHYPPGEMDRIREAIASAVA